MTVTNLTSRVDYAGAGSAGPFNYTFRIFANTDLLVTVRDTNDLETTLTYGSDYSVTGAGNAAGGTVTLQSVLAVGEALTIRRVLPLTQPTNLRNQGTFFPETVENALDREIMIAQQLSDVALGVVRLPETIDPDVFDTHLPVPLTPLSALVVNAAGDGFDMGTLSAAQLSAWSATQNQKLNTFTSAGGDFTPGVTTQLTLSAAPGNKNNMMITRRTSGAVIVYEHDEYSLSGTTLTFSVAIPASTTRVEVSYLYTYQVNTIQSENAAYSQAGTGAVTSTVRAALRRIVWAEDFGAVGDDSTTNTTAFQRASNQLTALGGGILRIGPGTFRTNQFTIGDDIWVQMSDATVLKCTSSTAARGVITNTAGSGGNTNLRVTGGEIQRTVTNGASFFDLIYFQNSSFIWIDGVRGIGAGTAPTSPTGNKGFTLDGCSYFWVTRNYLKNIPDNSIAANWTGSRSNGYGYIAENTIELTGTMAGWTHSGIVVTADHVDIVRNKLVTPGGGSVRFLVEAGDNVGDLLIQANEAASDALIVALSGRRFRILGNMAGAGGVNLSGNANDQFDHVIANNILTSLRVISESGGTMTKVVISGNYVHDATSTQGIVVQAASQIDIIGNVVSNCAKSGFGIFGNLKISVIGNVAHGCGASGSGDDDRNGFYFEGAGGTGVIARNVSHNNTGRGFFIEQPQNWHFLDNDYWSNGVADVTVNNPTLGGATPFQNVRLKGTGSPSFYGNPGSEYWRTDGDDKAAPVRYVKTSANTSNGGWGPVETSGTGGDTAASGTTTLPAGQLHRITGGTTITNITAAYAGRMVVLSSDGGGNGATDGGNLKLSANWAPGDTDTLTLVCDGTNWLEVTRSNN